MKKQILRLLLWFMALTLLSGCGQAPVAETEGQTVPATTAAPTTLVHTVDEFLSALACGADITLAPGTYDFSTASDSRQPTQDADYRWSDPEGALVLTGLDGLTIRGDGAILTTGAENAELLLLEDCTNLHLQDLTFRREGPTEAMAAVTLTGCTGAVLEGLKLEDSADLLCIRNCRDMQIRDCDFTGPALSALALYGSEAVVMENCLLHDLGAAVLDPLDFRNGWPLISVGISDSITAQTPCQDVAIRNCRLENNQMGALFSVDSGRKVYFEDNTVRNCSVQDAAFRFWNAAPHLVGNRYEGNQAWAWYDRFSEYGVDENGADVTPAQLYSTQEIPGTGPQKEVHVATADEFLAALAPDTHILLDCTLLDLSTASDYGKGSGDHYQWENSVDGPQLVIQDLNNLTVTGKGANETTISAVPRYANVLEFRFCTNLTLSGFTAGHTEEPGFCSGGVLNLKECHRVRMEGLGLYGCGILGISTHGGTEMTVTDCDIYECSFGGILLQGSGQISIDNTRFRDLGGPDLEALDCWDVLLDGKPYSEG